MRIRSHIGDIEHPRRSEEMRLGNNHITLFILTFHPNWTALDVTREGVPVRSQNHHRASISHEHNHETQEDNRHNQQQSFELSKVLHILNERGDPPVRLVPRSIWLRTAIADRPLFTALKPQR